MSYSRRHSLGAFGAAAYGIAALRVLVIALALLLVAAGTRTFAASQDERGMCGWPADLDVTIAACGRVIDDPLEVTRERVRAYINRGFVLTAKGDHNAALADLTEAIRLDPKSSLAYIYRGRVWSEKHDAGRAIADFTKAIRIDPRPETGLPVEPHLNAYFERATSRLRRSSFRSVMADLDQAIRIDRTNRMALLMRAVFRELLGDRKGAAADRATLQRLDPERCSDCSEVPDFNIEIVRDHRLGKDSRAELKLIAPRHDGEPDRTARNDA